MPAPAADVVARAYLHARSIDEFGELIGEGDAVARLRRELAAVAPLRSTVLILGETGVGKGLAARLIHELSPHRDRPFVHVDCAALATSVVESELFGHERGAFTGAASPRAGRFELAGEGTIFLDEIGDLDASVQVKLLRVLQDRAFERLGGVTTRVMPARVIAATNRDLRAAVSAGTFRMDLYFRLNVFQVRVPPLRERLCDLPALARAALERIAAQLEVPIPPLSDSFYERLRDREWPGNVRELMNEMERFLIRSQAGLDAVVESDGDETFACLPVGEDRAMLEEVLREAGGNISRAARRLGIARSTLRYRIARSGLDHLIPKD
jgi:transcriptional regulator with GAF, ATPase, and Fis domain